DRRLSLAHGNLLSIMSAGAYGMSMSSNYNTRPRAAEVMIDKSTVHIIRQRETIDQLIATEQVLP
ncbi:MAG: diaminopimelate decarboxylase, partial [Pseudomonadota bacterium]